MQLSIRLAAFASIIFAVVCLWFSVDEFASLDTIADPEEKAGARSFAWFWMFLAVAGGVIGWLSWHIGQLADKDR
jgi:hypothetical protein